MLIRILIKSTYHISTNSSNDQYILIQNDKVKNLGDDLLDLSGSSGIKQKTK